MSKLAIIGASGKLGSATLKALLDQRLIAPQNIVCTTSSDKGASKISAFSRELTIRRAHWDDEQSLTTALDGCERLFLISSSRIEKDFNDAALGKGREEDHFRAISAAMNAGVKHIYYTSLAFSNPSLSGVMTAHERTETYLRNLDIGYTIIREGLYNESWPLYLGHFEIDSKMTEVVISGDSKISWTSIADLGLANALILAEPPEKWNRKVFYLSQEKSLSLKEVADSISYFSNRKINCRTVSPQEYELYHVNERNMEAPFIKWWNKTYAALNQSECLIQDSTLESLLASKDVKPKKMEDTLKEMLKFY